jgi:hypothetical protein
MEYFFGKMALILKHEYIASNQELLRTGIRSIGRRTPNFQTVGAVYPKVRLRSWHRLIVPL